MLQRACTWVWASFALLHTTEGRRHDLVTSSGALSSEKGLQNYLKGRGDGSAAVTIVSVLGTGGSRKRKFVRLLSGDSESGAVGKGSFLETGATLSLQDSPDLGTSVILLDGSYAAASELGEEGGGLSARQVAGFASRVSSVCVLPLDLPPAAVGGQASEVKKAKSLLPRDVAACVKSLGAERTGEEGEGPLSLVAVLRDVPSSLESSNALKVLTQKLQKEIKTAAVSSGYSGDLNVEIFVLPTSSSPSFKPMMDTVRAKVKDASGTGKKVPSSSLYEVAASTWQSLKSQDVPAGGVVDGGAAAFASSLAARGSEQAAKAYFTALLEAERLYLSGWRRATLLGRVIRSFGTGAATMLETAERTFDRGAASVLASPAALERRLALRASLVDSVRTLFYRQLRLAGKDAEKKFQRRLLALLQEPVLPPGMKLPSPSLLEQLSPSALIRRARGEGPSVPSPADLGISPQEQERLQAERDALACQEASRGFREGVLAGMRIKIPEMADEVEAAIETAAFDVERLLQDAAATFHETPIAKLKARNKANELEKRNRAAAAKARGRKPKGVGKGVGWGAVKGALGLTMMARRAGDGNFQFVANYESPAIPFFLTLGFANDRGAPDQMIGGELPPIFRIQPKINLELDVAKE
uniref:Guanylate-binding protein N-terminal domain-containing protein n=1 Tax=Chromera velia CCMP2878 TaxID=1169474 RepID=A0A0G4FYF1_9ALVE|eukprot:Cvel_19360.t1-p1 / transcript=Cvel_19360.t1 / gene=Cvel_19360 / organism=Chromera_velia_CCMP2878 / gene_product=hypothetical protein / transcript_product=hypothetical protein / location=Cvel_scaffold1663:36113-40386(-) / protein_length=643 / sequence_SO=supercontig / SO=protein_coding / is_pseudo=false